MREAKKKLLIQNGIFSHLELDVLKGLFEFQKQFEKQYDIAAKNFCENNDVISEKACEAMNERKNPDSNLLKKWTEMHNEIVDELYKKYGKGLFVVKFKNYSFKLFGLDIQYHDKIHFKNLIDNKFVGLEPYQSKHLRELGSLFKQTLGYGHKIVNMLIQIEL